MITAVSDSINYYGISAICVFDYANFAYWTSINPFNKSTPFHMQIIPRTEGAEKEGYSVIGLKENQRLVYAGETALRAPDGTPLPAVPQYMIVSVDEADPAFVAELQDNERLILAGTVHNERISAEERFAALKAGQAQPPRAAGIPLYIKEDAENINPKTRLSESEEKACEPLIGDLVSAFSVQMRKMKALERQGKAVAENGT